jgi:putative ABC transport system ATP-binding protein
MERGIFNFILRYSGRDQLALVAISALAMPFLYLSFELPKTIVNQALDSNGQFPKTIFGTPFEQVPYLWLLCGAFLGLVIVNGAIKFLSSTYRYRVGDRLLRRLRYDLVERLLRFPVKQFRNTSSGQVVSMVTAETSSLGFFMAEAFAVPAVAAGTLGTIVFFMFMQDWLMGVAAIALYPVQIYIIPRIQRQVNDLQRREVLAIRGMSDRIGEIVAAAPEIHGHDTSQYELARISNRLSNIFNLRVQISVKRYTVNLLNQFFSQLTPFFFLSIGGYLVITNEITLGSLVAVLAAYKDMYAPWKDLIDYYQKAEESRVKFDQLREYFAPASLMDRTVIDAEPSTQVLSGLLLTATNVVVEAEEGVKPIDGATLVLNLPVHAAVVGGTNAAREEFARLLARQVLPLTGRVQVGETDLATLPDSVTGRRIGYVGPEPYLNSGSIRDALVYPLLHRPLAELNTEGAGHEHIQRDLEEAERAGNSKFSIHADWIDYAAAGCARPGELRWRIIEVLRFVDLEQDVVSIALRRMINPTDQPLLASRLIQARLLLRDRLEAQKLTQAVETFDRSRYIENASVAENILFGTPIGLTFAVEQLAENELMLATIDRVGLTQEFIDRGRKLASIMVDIFKDLTPGHDFFERFSFIRAEDLPEFDAILRRLENQTTTDKGIVEINDADRARLMALPFKLVASQHHVGLLDQGFRQSILAARERFAQDLPAEIKQNVQFFDINAYNGASTIADNILFGKLAVNKAEQSARVQSLLLNVMTELGLLPHIIDLGLEYDIGPGGAKLTMAQRQKLAIGRCLLKKPDILILNDALSALDAGTQDTVFECVRRDLQGRSLILLEPDEGRAASMERILTIENGKIIDRTGSVSHAEPRTASDPNKQKAEQNIGLYDLASILGQIPLFADIDRSKLKLLAFTSERVEYQSGDTVFRQGDVGHKAYVVLSGLADVVLETADGEVVVAELGQFQVFGEMALLSNIPRSTTIRARSALSLLVLSHDVFMRLVSENADIALGMTRVLAERLASTLRDYSRVRSNGNDHTKT